MKPLALAAALAVLSAPGAAGAHGVEAEVARSDADIAVRARYHGGRPLAGASYEVVSPAHPERAHETGRTDRHGWVAFEADAPGTWRIRIADASGHGRLVEVEVTAGDLAAARAAAEPRPTTPSVRAEPVEARGSTGSPRTEAGGPLRGLYAQGERGAGTAEPPDERAPGATPLRVAAGALAIVVLFGAVFAVQRRLRRGAR
jgi:hypothetical protein